RKPRREKACAAVWEQFGGAEGVGGEGGGGRGGEGRRRAEGEDGEGGGGGEPTSRAARGGGTHGRATRAAERRRVGAVRSGGGGFDPGVLDPGGSAPAVIVGGAFERPQANGFFLGWANGVDEIDRSPFAQSAQRRAVLPTGDLADLGFGGLSCDAGEFESAG